MPFPHLLVLWGGLFLLIQQVERLFLLPTALSIESPTTTLILKTLAAGFLQDLAASAGELAVSGLLAVPVGLVVFPFSKRNGFTTASEIYAKCFTGSAGLLAILLIVILTVDMGYYRFSHQHLDFVFFEYVADLWSAPVAGTQESQAAQQTSAEIQNGETWGYRVSGFLFLEGVALLVWWNVFRRKVRRQVAQWGTPSTLALNGFLAAAFVTGATGVSPHSMPILRSIDSDAYFTVAQNPILFAKDSARAALFHQWEWVPLVSQDAPSWQEAVALSQRHLGHDAVFPYQLYPFVSRASGQAAVRFQEPLNVLVIFVEGLDRRYLNRTVQVDRPIRVTPFLDQLKQQSLYFDNFFTNGVQTSRGLFATLCSYYPRQGAAAIKTRSTRDYLCLPSLLHERGYRTEMVVGQQGSINNLRSFFTQNGIDHLYDIDDFPVPAERMGLGMTDAAIFDFITERVRTAQSSGQPLFLTTLTLSTHHPFVFPAAHAEVKALTREADQYVPALRYFDLEFERFFTGLQREGLLKNTIVFVLGDHGRHEPQGRSDVEKQVGHFMAPLFVWLDESLRTHDTFRPRIVDTIASQVDVAPTILAVSGLTPNVSPFVGHDLSCVFVGECLQGNTAYLTSVYDDLIGLAGKNGIWLYSFRKEMLYWTDLAVQSPVRTSSGAAVDTSSEYRKLLSLYVASNVLLEQNRIWSWRDLKHAL